MAPASQKDMQAFLQQLIQKVQYEEHAIAEASDAIQQPHTNYPNWQQPVLEERSITYSTGDTYKGSMLGHQRHGQGTHTTATGDVYQGNWSYDQRSGTGKFAMADGTCYEGEWQDDKADGKGKCTYRYGTVYDGEWRADHRWGWGSLATADGQHYEGEWERNQPHGQGRWVLADGFSYYEGSYEAGQRKQGQLVIFDSATRKPSTSYTGSFLNNLKHGDGVMVCEGAWVYRGAWRHDARSGEGTCNFISGDEYVGEWKDDMKHGRGVLKLVNGDRYDGQWLNDQRHGMGTMKYATGERYVGQWQHNKRHGQGKWTSAPTAVGPTAAAVHGAACEESREMYFGHWINDRREAQGVATFADGGRYQGSWKADQRHGEGIMTFSDGVIFRGMWEYGEWIQSAAEPAFCRVEGPGLSEVIAGQNSEFTITAKDENNNLRLNGGDTFHVLLVPARNPTGPAIEVALQQQQQEQRQQQQHASLCTTPTEPELLLAGSIPGSSSSSNSFYADVQQHQQQEVDSDDACLSLAELVTAVAVGEVQDNGNGSYSCSYCYTEAGKYELHIMNGENEHVAGSPFPISISPGPPSVRHSTVTGAGKHTAVAGAQAAFEITVRDAHGNDYNSTRSNKILCTDQLQELLPVKAELLGSNTLPVTAVDVHAQPGGHFSCSYTAPAAAGLYVLEVTSNGKHLCGSPFSVKVTPPPPPAGAASSADPALSSCANAAGTGPCSSSNSSSCKPQLLEDKVSWWGQVAKAAYAAVDGSLEGYEQQHCTATEDCLKGLSRQEADLVKANPQVPVVERLEDLWLLSKLQQERKAQKEQQQQQHQPTGTSNKAQAGKLPSVPDYTNNDATPLPAPAKQQQREPEQQAKSCGADAKQQSADQLLSEERLDSAGVAGADIMLPPPLQQQQQQREGAEQVPKMVVQQQRDCKRQQIRQQNGSAAGELLLQALPGSAAEGRSSCIQSAQAPSAVQVGVQAAILPRLPLAAAGDDDPAPGCPVAAAGTAATAGVAADWCSLDAAVEIVLPARTGHGTCLDLDHTSCRVHSMSGCGVGEHAAANAAAAATHVQCAVAKAHGQRMLAATDAPPGECFLYELD